MCSVQIRVKNICLELNLRIRFCSGSEPLLEYWSLLVDLLSVVDQPFQQRWRRVAKVFTEFVKDELGVRPKGRRSVSHSDKVAERRALGVARLRQAAELAF